MNKESLDRIEKGLAIAIVWDIEDVKGMEDGVDLTDEEAKAVLARVEYNHDCNYGISWETFQCAIEMIKEERGK